MRVYSFFAVLMLCIQGNAAEATEIRVVTSPGLSAVFKVVGPQFERATGHKLKFQYGLETTQRRYIQAGEFDLAIVPSHVLDHAIKDGKIAADSRTPVARAGLSVGVRAGARKPDVGSVDAFKDAMVAAKSVAYAANESTGRQIAKDFDTLGIAEIMKAKIKPQKTVPLVWQAVASVGAELGFSFTSNLLSAPGVELVGSFPIELQYSVAMVAGIGSAAHETDAAKAFIDFLREPEAVAVLKAKGLQPPDQ
jgi:molybdate transport system substrate-binding protein